MPRMVKQRPTTSYTTFIAEDTTNQASTVNYNYFDVENEDFVFNLIENHSDLAIENIKQIISMLNQEDLSQTEQLKNIKMKIFNNLPNIKGKLINNLIDNLITIYQANNHQLDINSNKSTEKENTTKEVEKEIKSKNDNIENPALIKEKAKKEAKNSINKENNTPKVNESEVFKALATTNKTKKTNVNKENNTSKEVKGKLYIVNYQNPDNSQEVGTKTSPKLPKWLSEKLKLGFELKNFEVEPFEIIKGQENVPLGKFLYPKELNSQNEESFQELETIDEPLKENKKEAHITAKATALKKIPSNEMKNKPKAVEVKVVSNFPQKSIVSKVNETDNIDIFEEAYFQALSDIEKFYNEHENYHTPSVSLIKREIAKFERIWEQYKIYNKDEDIIKEQQDWVSRLKNLITKTQNSNLITENQKKNLIENVNEFSNQRLSNTNNSQKVRDFNLHVDSIYKDRLNQVHQLQEKLFSNKNEVNENPTNEIKENKEEEFDGLVEDILPVENEDSKELLATPENLENENFKDDQVDESKKNQIQKKLENFLKKYENSENLKNLTELNLNSHITLLSDWRNTPPKNEDLADEISMKFSKLVEDFQNFQLTESSQSQNNNATEDSIEDNIELDIEENIKDNNESDVEDDELDIGINDEPLETSSEDNDESLTPIASEKKNDIENEITKIVDELDKECLVQGEVPSIDETSPDTLETIYTQAEPNNSLENQLPPSQECVIDDLTDEVDQNLKEVDDNQQQLNPPSTTETDSSNLFEKIQSLDTDDINKELQKTLIDDSANNQTIDEPIANQPTDNTKNNNQTTINNDSNQIKEPTDEELNPFKGNYDLPNFDNAETENASSDFELDIDDEDDNQINNEDSTSTKSIASNSTIKEKNKIENKIKKKKEKVTIKNESINESISQTESKLKQLENKLKNIKNNFFKNKSNSVKENTTNEVKNKFSNKIKSIPKLTLFGGLFILLFLLLAGGYMYLQQSPRQTPPSIIKNNNTKPQPQLNQTQPNQIKNQSQLNENDNFNLDADLFNGNDLTINDPLIENLNTNNVSNSPTNQTLEKVEIPKDVAKVVSVKVNNENKKVPNQSQKEKNNKENEIKNTPKELNKEKTKTLAKSKNNDLCGDIANVKGRMVVPMARSNLTSFLAGEAKFKNGCHLYAGKKIGQTQVLEIDTNNLSIKTTNGIIYFE